MTIETFRERGAYFFFPKGFPANKPLTLIALFQGFQDLGIPVHSNIDHIVRGEPRTVFRNTGADINASACVLTDLHFYKPSYATNEDIHNKLRSFPNEKQIFVTMEDNCQFCVLPEDLPVLTVHQTEGLRQFGTRPLWTIGLSRGIQERTRETRPINERVKTFIANFRPSGSSEMRPFMQLALFPNFAGTGFELFTEQTEATGATFQDADFIEMLTSSYGSMGYCGTIGEDMQRNPFFKDDPGQNYMKKIMEIVHEPYFVRWESFRFWESLAAGCLTLNLDCAKYGLKMPVPIGSWEHYAAIDLADPKGTVERIIDEPDRMIEIAQAGQRFVHEHYSPAAAARRFITDIWPGLRKTVI